MTNADFKSHKILEHYYRKRTMVSPKNGINIKLFLNFRNYSSRFLIKDKNFLLKKINFQTKYVIFYFHSL